MCLFVPILRYCAPSGSGVKCSWLMAVHILDAQVPINYCTSNSWSLQSMLSSVFIAIWGWVAPSDSAGKKQSETAEP